MDLYQRQQFDFFLQVATERFVERLQQRFRGPEPALKQLQADRQGEGVWLAEFVHAVFEDFLLANVDGAAFVLRSLPKKAPPPVTASTVEGALTQMAESLFAELLFQKTIEALQQQDTYQSVQIGDH